jgi:hypothetical protein
MAWVLRRNSYSWRGNIKINKSKRREIFVFLSGGAGSRDVTSHAAEIFTLHFIQAWTNGNLRDWIKMLDNDTIDNLLLQKGLLIWYHDICSLFIGLLLGEFKNSSNPFTATCGSLSYLSMLRPSQVCHHLRVPVQLIFLPQAPHTPGVCGVECSARLWFLWKKKVRG